jgi:hypothetical protein
MIAGRWEPWLSRIGSAAAERRYGVSRYRHATCISSPDPTDLHRAETEHLLDDAFALPKAAWRSL